MKVKEEIMKKFLSLLLAAVMMLGLVACGGGNSGSGGSGGSAATPPPSNETAAPSGGSSSGEEEKKLVIYTASSDEQINIVVPLYEEMYGVEVEVVSAGTGELLARADSEKANPYADVFFGGGESNLTEYSHLFQDYVSSEDGNLVEEFRNTTGFITNYYLDCPVLLYNNDLIGDLEIKGYEDLLQPELKGKISCPDPTSSSSAIMHVETILTDFGGLTMENETGWKFIEDLFTNFDGKMASGSSAAYKSVVDGENVVAMTYEEASIRLVGDGANVTLVYMEEGTVFTPTTVAVLANCKHPDNAKKFIDLVLSQKVQNILCNELCLRPVRDDVEYPEYFASVADVYTVHLDQAYINEHKADIANKCKDIFTTVGF